MDYLSYFIDYPDPMGLLLLLLLGMVRFAPIVVFAPFLGAKLIPGPVRMGLVLLLSIIFLPQLMTLTPTPLSFDMVYLGYLLKELVVGFVLGFLIGIPFYIASTSGTLVDHQRGSSSLMRQDPALANQASSIGLLYNYVLIVMFFNIGGPKYFFESVSLSFEIIPPTGWISPQFFRGLQTPFWQQMIHLGNHVMSLATQLAAPPLVAIFMSDLFLGIANRMATMVPMSFLGWALKSLAGLAVLYAAWYFIMAQLNINTMNWLQAINQVIESLAYSIT